MDKITTLDKHVINNSITFHIRTESGDRYQVILLKNGALRTESIYYIDFVGRTALLRRRTLAVNDNYEQDFQEFIERGDARLSN